MSDILNEITAELKASLLKEEAELIKANVFEIDVDDCSNAERKELLKNLLWASHDMFFSRFSPNKNSSSFSFDSNNREKSIIDNTFSCYNIKESEGDKLSDDVIKNMLTKENHIKIMQLLIKSEFIMRKDELDKLISGDDAIKQAKDMVYKDIKSGWASIYMENLKKAVNLFEEEGKIVSVLNSDDKADIIKLLDKYAIRLGDGKHYVASDEVKISFRDPSENPSWATWFMDAVPLADIPDRAELLFLTEEEREEKFPKELEDNPIICHASLWKLDGATGVLLHTSWCHIAATYRWKIDKPFEIASLMFKAVSHPAHLARNFGYAPQLKVPGSDWF